MQKNDITATTDIYQYGRLGKNCKMCQMSKNGNVQCDAFTLWERGKLEEGDRYIQICKKQLDRVLAQLIFQLAYKIKGNKTEG